MQLVSIYVAWKGQSGAEPYLIYDALKLGEGVARQRAAQRVAMCKSLDQPVTAYRFDYDDGTSVDKVE
jgi:hypothetical protein